MGPGMPGTRGGSKERFEDPFIRRDLTDSTKEMPMINTATSQQMLIGSKLFVWKIGSRAKNGFEPVC